MPSCCQGASCACRIVAGQSVVVTGTGTTQDPFVITADVGLIVTDNTTFNLTLGGAGTVGDPWSLSVDYASTAKLDDLPDVNAPTPANGQVLAWSSGTSRWVPQNPTTAASGSVSHNTSLSGDGSVGTPLAVVVDPARFLTSGASGVGMSDAGINQLVRGFADSTAQAAASPVPDLNALSMLDSNPGALYYWTGTSWQPVQGAFDVTTASAEFLNLSGGYSGQRQRLFLKNISATTDASGVFDVLTPTDLSGQSGVLVCQFQETGAAGSMVGWKAVLYPNSNRVSAVAYRVTDGSVFAGQVVTGSVTAWLY